MMIQIQDYFKIQIQQHVGKCIDPKDDEKNGNMMMTIFFKMMMTMMSKMRIFITPCLHRLGSEAKSLTLRTLWNWQMQTESSPMTRSARTSKSEIFPDFFLLIFSSGFVEIIQVQLLRDGDRDVLCKIWYRRRWSFQVRPKKNKN